MLADARRTRGQTRRGRRALAAARRLLLEDRRGVSTVEFALILPIFLAIYFGTAEASNMISNVRKVDLLSQTVGDLIAGTQTPAAAQVNDMLQAAQVVLAPFDPRTAQIVVSATGVFGSGPSGQLRVCSSAAGANASPRSAGDLPPVPIPPGFQVDGTRLLLVEIGMPYKPLAGKSFAAFIGTSVDNITFTRRLLWPVRSGRRYASPSPEVVLPGGKACPAA